MSDNTEEEMFECEGCGRELPMYEMSDVMEMGICNRCEGGKDMEDYEVVVEISCLGQVAQVTIAVSAEDEDDAIHAAQEKARDNTVFFANEAEKVEE